MWNMEPNCPSTASVKIAQSAISGMLGFTPTVCHAPDIGKRPPPVLPGKTTALLVRWYSIFWKHCHLEINRTTYLGSGSTKYLYRLKSYWGRHTIKHHDIYIYIYIYKHIYICVNSPSEQKSWNLSTTSNLTVLPPVHFSEAPFISMDWL